MSQGKQSKLADIVKIMPGYPFRGAVKSSTAGKHLAVLPKDVHEAGFDLDLAQITLTEVELKGRRTPDIVRTGDILFIAKGIHRIASYVSSSLDNIVCTPHFFHLRINAKLKDLVLPEFLAWQINHHKAQNYFNRIAQGSAIASSAINKLELGDLCVSIPPIEQQSKLVMLIQNQIRQQQLHKQLIENSNQILKAVGDKILN